jgi:hypothetical protein
MRAWPGALLEHPTPEGPAAKKQGERRIIRSGVYIDDQGLLFAGQTEDGGLIVVRAPLSLDELEAAAATAHERVLQLNKIGKTLGVDETFTFRQIEAGTPTEEFRRQAQKELAGVSS